MKKGEITPRRNEKEKQNKKQDKSDEGRLRVTERENRQAHQH